ncbi:MAG: hypothetical protein IAF02_19200 [Anaerolineae bacterium]|nr:hypothetical protein [Anaerolineae bacterium]
MYAIEFHTKIKNGLIEIPQEYWDRLHQASSDDRVRVILLTVENPSVNDELEEDMISKLLTEPLLVPEFVPMRREDVYERA